MFSNMKQTFYHVRDSLIKHRWLLTAELIWMIVCTFWTVSEQKKMYQFYHLSASTIDYVIAQQRALYSGLTIFPFVLFFVIKCKQDSLNIQYILRYQSRKRMFQQQLKESLVYAAGLSFIIILMATFTGWIFSRNLINWDTMESVYFGQTGNVVKSNFLSVAVVIWLMYVLKLMLLFTIVDLSLWYPKTLFFVWIVLLIPLGIEALHYGKIYFSLFAVWQTSWNTPGKWLGIIQIGIVVSFIEKLIGEKMIERRDIWR